MGNVTWNGASVEEGVVLFVPSSGPKRSPFPSQIKDGVYALDAKSDLLAGSYRIEIRAHRKTGEKVEAGEAQKKLVELTEQYLSPQFNENSNLVKELKSGENQLDFHLTE